MLLELTATIRNNGDRDIRSPFTVSCYIILENESTENKHEIITIDEIRIPSLNQSETKYLSTYWIAKDRGVQSIWTFADSTNDEWESNESNNWANLVESDLSLDNLISQ